MWDAAIEAIFGSNMYFFFFFFSPIHRKQDIKNWSELSSYQYLSKERDVRGPLTQLSARGISSAAVRSPFYYRLCSRLFFFFSFISKLLFKTSLASLLLSRCLPPVLFVRIHLSVRLAVLPPFSLPTHPTDPSPFTPLSSSAPIVSSENSKR